MFFFCGYLFFFSSGIVGNLRQDRADRFFYLQQSGNDLAQLLQYVQRRLYFSPSLCYNYGNTGQFSVRCCSGCRDGSSAVDLSRLAKITEPYLVNLYGQPYEICYWHLCLLYGLVHRRTIIVCGMSVAIFGSILNLYTGFGEADPEKLKLIETLGGGKKEKLMKIILPSSVPLLLSVMKV